MKKTAKITFLGLMLAMVFILSAIEHSLPPILPPNMRLGLANVVTMYCLFFVGRRYALAVNGLKAFFVFLTRGYVAGLLSLCGGLLSIFIIIILSLIFKKKISYTLLSVFGAIFHNFGQLVTVSLILGSSFAVFYLPVIIFFGVLTGFATGTLLRFILPVFDKICGQTR